MANGQRPPAEFDGFADKYEDLIRDPMREKFARDNAFFFERKIQVVRDFFSSRKINTQALSWLDVGCGRGDLLRAGRGLFASSAGCDLSEKMLQACAGFEVRHQTAEDRLPFDDGSFDFVTAVCVYHHVAPDRRVSLTLEMKRLLKPRGGICIIEHNPLNPVARLIVSRTPVDADAQLLRTSEARRLLSDARFNILGLTYFLMLPQILYRRFAPIERSLSFLPLGGQYSLFAQK